MQPFSFSGSGVNVGFGGIEKILSGRTAESGISTASMEIQHTAPGKCGLSTTSQSPPKPSPRTSIGVPARTALTTSYAEPGPSQQSVSASILGRSSPGVGVALSTAGAPVDVSPPVSGVSVEVAEALGVFVDSSGPDPGAAGSTVDAVEVNLFSREEPRAASAPMMTTATRAAIRPYSMAVAPYSLPAR